MTRRGAVALLMGVGAAALSGCSLLDTRASYRFRMTVELSTSHGIRRASSVYEVKAVKNVLKLLTDERAEGAATVGEAVVVDSSNGDLLFVLMDVPVSGERLPDVVTRTFVPAMPRGGIDNFITAVRAVGQLPLGHSANLPHADWPTMVRFRDLSDPKTIEVVDPRSVGVSRIVLTVTSDPITRGLERKLPSWFKQLAADGARLDGDNSIAVSTHPSSVAGKFSPVDFSTAYSGDK